ncbi:MAG: metallophosphoesterase family protein [Acidimicrobiia bacterium]
MHRSPFRQTAIVITVLVLGACSANRASMSADPSASTAATTTTPSAPPVTLLAAGDVADCKLDGDTKTAALLEQLPGSIAVLGDLAYDSGTTKEFADCYAPTWGRFNERAYPVPGNHEYNTKNATPYYAYFGARAGDPTKGWYSYNLGAWHIIALNSNCDAIGGCTATSPQGVWLQQDLAANRTPCTLAYWHHPRFSSGPHGSNEFMQPFWEILSTAGADIVLSGHDHDYERFAPMTATGAVANSGLRQFVVGTGGRTLYPILFPRVGSEASNATTFGVLELSLADDSYRWEFHPVEGGAFTDSGSTRCA